ncbi:hypothetical protein TNCV_2479451 [Trichonephila clavipes]|nr:hypothetical protein TNCV_2479451 [Trichonephila clavipes]
MHSTNPLGKSLACHSRLFTTNPSEEETVIFKLNLLYIVRVFSLARREGEKESQESINSICHLQIKHPHHRRDSTASLYRRYYASPGPDCAVPKHETVCPLLTAVEVLDACTTAVSSETKGGKDSINNGLPLTS